MFTFRRFTLVTSLLAGGALHAQASDSIARTTRPLKRTTVVTLNPLALIGGFFNADAESAVTPAVTLGAGASYAAFGNFDSYSAAEAKVRYYPQERALYGFSVAAGVGIASYKQDGPYYAYDATGSPIYGSATGGERRTRATVGTELSYQWLLGPRKRFVTVLGVGVKRFLGAEDYSSPFDANVIPTARINIGVAF